MKTPIALNTYCF